MTTSVERDSSPRQQNDVQPAAYVATPRTQKHAEQTEAESERKRGKAPANAKEKLAKASSAADSVNPETWREKSRADVGITRRRTQRIT